MGLPRRLRNAAGRAWLRAFRWEVEGTAPDAPRAVVVAAPHTSNWDLPFTLAIAWSLDLDIQWVGKHTLFETPVWGAFLRSLGGIGVDRRGRNDAVKAIAEAIRERERILLIVPPEGTRGAATRWKTGFYWIAIESDVPIVLGFLDYARRRGGFGHVFRPTGDIERDFAKLREFYADVKGKFPERQGAIALGDADKAAAAAARRSRPS
jgi:1-acyl-sn-glycerol-3-phosphate acyltransferase